MKNKLKNLFKYILAFTLIAVISCEKDIDENLDPKKEATLTLDKKYLNGNELPSDIQDYININDTKRIGKSDNTTTSLSNAIFTTHDIISITNEKNITNYSLSFFYPDTPENVFYNLVINVLPTGESTKYIFKYICNPADLDNFKAHHYDFKYFVGITEISTADNNGSKSFTSKSTSGDDPCPKIFIPSKTDLVNNNTGTTSGGSNGGTSSDGSSGFNTSVPGYNTPGYTAGSSLGPTTGSGGHDHSGCYGSNGEYWYYDGGDRRPPHSHTSKIAVDCPDFIPPVGYVPVSTMPMIKVLGAELALSRDQIFFLCTNPDTMNVINAYWEGNNRSQRAKEFAKKIIDIIKIDPTIDRNALIFTLSAETKNKMYTELDDSFLMSMDNYMDEDLLAIKNSNPDLIIHFGTQHMIKTLRLKNLNPEWSFLKCYWEASKEVVHITLDVFGTVPVVGELADITNGVLYIIEGDGVNATLSFAGAVPFAGWAAVSTRYAIKFRQATNLSTRVKLIWKKLPDETVYFGGDSYCRKQLRKILGLTVGNLKQAHHIIPLNLQTNSIVQKAAKSGEAFHLNDLLNGIPLDKTIHNGSHSHYDGLIFKKLEGFRVKNINATPDQCYDVVNKIIESIRTAIKNNPNTPINQLIF